MRRRWSRGAAAGWERRRGTAGDDLGDEDRAAASSDLEIDPRQAISRIGRVTVGIGKGLGFTRGTEGGVL